MQNNFDGPVDSRRVERLYFREDLQQWETPSYM
jgi:hypothetical protein